MASILDTLDRPNLAKQRHKRMHPLDRIARNTRRDEATGCLIWTGRATNAGYGQITVTQVGYQTKTFSAHRASYELHKGRVPEGLVLDHLCRNRLCVEPEHLEPVTLRENVLRSPVAQAAINAAKTHCPQGHAYDESNTHIYAPGNYVGRICKACTRARKPRATRKAA